MSVAAAVTSPDHPLLLTKGRGADSAAAGEPSEPLQSLTQVGGIDLGQ